MTGKHTSVNFVYCTSPFPLRLSSLLSPQHLRHPLTFFSSYATAVCTSSQLISRLLAHPPRIHPNLCSHCTELATPLRHHERISVRPVKILLLHCSDSLFSAIVFSDIALLHNICCTVSRSSATYQRHRCSYPYYFTPPSPEADESMAVRSQKSSHRTSAISSAMQNTMSRMFLISSFLRSPCKYLPVSAALQ